ncbi:MAG: dTMP kinase [Chloroflexi bacterium]|nr:dTMP kinase [Chloroflexota bacterium]
MTVDGRRRGLFIAFEGPEGSGKSTQAQLLAQRLRWAGLDVLLTREPGGTDFGERLRELMLDERSLPDMQPRVQALLMLAARAQHVAERIRPWLRSRGVVICDRFSGSTIAYQGAGFGLDTRTLDAMNRFAAFGVRPDLTVLLDLDVRLGLARSYRQRGDDWEKAGGMNAEKLDFHTRVRNSYLDQAIWQDWKVLDASRPRDELHVAVWHIAAQQIATRKLRVADAVQPPLPLGGQSEALALDAWRKALVNAGMLQPLTAVQPPLPLGAWGEELALEAWKDALASAGMLPPAIPQQRTLPLDVSLEWSPEPPTDQAGPA